MQAGGQIGKLAYIDDQTTTAQVRNGQQTTNGVPTNTMQWGVYGVYLGLFSKQILCDFWIILGNFGLKMLLHEKILIALVST